MIFRLERESATINQRDAVVVGQPAKEDGIVTVIVSASVKEVDIGNGIVAVTTVDAYVHVHVRDLLLRDGDKHVLINCFCFSCASAFVSPSL
jgi:hypothetical protein